MIPKYPFYVEVYKRSGDKRWRETKNFESLITANMFAQSMMGKQGVTSVTISVRMFEYNTADLFELRPVS
jgi:hypothetical protein